VNRQTVSQQTTANRLSNQHSWHWNTTDHNGHHHDAFHDHHHHRDFAFFFFPGFFSPFFCQGFYPFHFYPYYASQYYADFGSEPYYTTYYGGASMPEWYYDTTVRLPPEMPPADPSAHLSVRVPADAEIWVDGVATKQTGAERQFVSPPLEAGQEYSYELKARWIENGREIVQTRRIPVVAGLWKTVDFTQPDAERIAPPKRVR
jgi:uncharacterized protein (TIGR03000 family)